MLAAQTKAIVAQSLPTLQYFSGDESFDEWLEQFEERAFLSGWLDDDRKYRLKIHLDKIAFHAYQNLSSETKMSYSAVLRPCARDSSL